ncbi:glycosyltransferase family 2 protein [Candidatus Saccharibacteria bacterium]|nr:glycosyltransferase family 2 protein [Candidatus Saccharibacteria bacterium]
MSSKVSVVVPNWNGAERLPPCLDSLARQTLKHHVIVVDNGSIDASRAVLYSRYPEVEVIPLPKNRGFAGGVNAGLRRAIELEYDFAALLNNDASPEPGWLGQLVSALDKNPTAGIVTSKMLDANQEYLDSTGEIYTIWGLPYPRGRREADTAKYDKDTAIFGASGGASLYRVAMLRKIGLFDEDYFAYYEDVDLSFRAQLSGWKVLYVPSARVSHHIGGTTDSLKGFGTYQTLKNLPWLAVKNLPLPLLPRVLPRLAVAYTAFFISAIAKGEIWPAAKGSAMMLSLLPKKIFQRWKIQAARQISIRYINLIIERDLPPNARSLRRLRDYWHRLLRKAS